MPLFFSALIICTATQGFNINSKIIYVKILRIIGDGMP